jgi:iron complex outermembrane recepter protein
LRYITKKPSFEETRGYLKIAIGDYERTDVKAGVNIPVSDTLAVGFSAASLSRDGYVKRLSDGENLGNEDTQFASAQLRWAPSDELDVYFGVDYTLRDADDGPTKLIDYYTYNGSADTGRAPASKSWNSRWGTTALAYGPEIPNSLYRVGGEGRMGVNEAESIGVTLNVAYQLTDSIDLKWITGYRDVEEYGVRDPDDQESAHTYFDDIVEEGVEFWSQELQLSGIAASDRLNWVAGLYYSEEKPYRHEKEDRYGSSRSSYGVLMLNDTAEQKTESFGVYAQGTYDVTEELAVTVGVRYSEDKKDYTLSQVAVWDFELDSLADQLGLTDIVPASSCDPTVTGSCLSVALVSG